MKAKTIPGFPNYTAHENGDIFRNGELLKPCVSNGTEIVCLVNNTIRTTRSINKIIATLFVPNPENLSKVAPRDRDPKNHHYTNLIWITYSEMKRGVFKYELLNILKTEGRYSRKQALENGWRSLQFLGLSHYRVTVEGEVFRLENLKWLRSKPYVGNHGYVVVHLHDDDGKGLPWSVHRLVALAFLEPIPGANHVNHKNLDRMDNSLINLEWCTPFENMQHAIENGVISRDLPFELVRDIKQKMKDGVSLADIARDTNVAYHTIRNMRHGKCYKHVTLCDGN